MPEPVGGAHTNPEEASRLVDEALTRTLAEVGALAPEQRLDARYAKFRNMGRLGIDFTEM